MSYAYLGVGGARMSCRLTFFGSFLWFFAWISPENVLYYRLNEMFRREPLYFNL